MLYQNSVCSVVVIYNGDSNLKQNIISLLKQTDKVIAIDNNSTEDITEYIQEFLPREQFVFIKNEKNEGIAYALNQGLSYATQNKYKYILTMDQDSILADGSVKKMLQLMQENNIESIGANYFFAQNESELISKNFLISSGNLTLVESANQVGGYENKMFIDGVDIDFSLKLRAANKKIAIARDAAMQHKLGTSYLGKWLFFKKEIAMHSPLRIYYIFRNNKYLTKKYKNMFKNYCLKLKIGIFLIKLDILLFYPKALKKQSLNSAKRGSKDGRML